MKQKEIMSVIRRLCKNELTPSAYRVALAAIELDKEFDRFFVEHLLQCAQQQAARTISELLRKGVICEVSRHEHSCCKKYNLVVIETMRDDLIQSDPDSDLDGQMKLRF